MREKGKKGEREEGGREGEREGEIVNTLDVS